jgi:hypothetical protein
MGVLQEAAKRILRDELETIRDGYDSLEANHLFLKETIAELQMQIEDEGWLPLSGYGLDQFNRDTLNTLAERSRVLYLKNPLIQRGANVKRLYVWGQGVNIQAKDERINEVIQTFLSDRRNKIELTGHQGRMLKEIELQTDGNLFFTLFVNKSTGYVRLASIPFAEIMDITSNPEDAKEPWLYLREWTEEQRKDTPGSQYNFNLSIPRKAYYRDWQYEPLQSMRSSNNIEVREGLIYHVKVGAFSDWKFGCSEHYAAHDWAKAYKEFLEDWATLTRAYARFAWLFSGTKSKAEISRVKSALATTLGQDTSETNPPSLVGSAAIVGEGRSLTPIRTAGATVSAEDGRRLLLMVCATEGLPETFFGDVSVGTLATATSLDRPTELAMRDRQTLWQDIFLDLLNFVKLQAVKATSGPLRSLGTYRREKWNGQWEEWVEWKAGVDDSIDIDFPPLVQATVKDNVAAIVDAATMRGLPSAGMIPQKDVSRLLLLALGADDIDDMLNELYPEDGRQAQGYVPEEESLAEAARILRDGLDRLIEKHAT